MIFENPVRGVIAPTMAGSGFRMTQDFGPGIDAEPKVVWPGGEGFPAGTYPHFHRGIDLGNRGCGSDVLAAAAGVVRVSYKTAAGEHVIVIDHGGGWCSSYGHLASRVVAKGAGVTKGMRIGSVGATGNAIGCHLHFGIKSDVPAGSNYYLNSVGKMRDPWRRLRQNITLHLADKDAINIRTTAGSGSTPGPKFASTKNGRILNLDGADLGAADAPRRWGSTVKGASWALPDGTTGDTWESFQLDGGLRFVVPPLAVLSAR